LKELGVRWVRFDFDWSKIQPNSATSYNWAGYDKVADALRANGINGLGIIDYTPAWARRDDCSSSDKCEPKNLTDFANFAGSVAARYGPKGMHTWEIWNEPNSAEFWLPTPNTADYTQMLKQSYLAIKHADIESTVLTGGTSSAGTGNNNFAASDFLAGIYTNGGRGYFDAVADHPYSRPFLPAFNWYRNAWQQMANTQPSIRSVMIANGDTNKKIWITEYGAATNGPGVAASNGLYFDEQNADHVTEALQARMAALSYKPRSHLPLVGTFLLV